MLGEAVFVDALAYKPVSQRQSRARTVLGVASGVAIEVIQKKLNHTIVM